MRNWHDLLRTVLEEGEERPDRTGVGTKSIFGATLCFANTESVFPAVTTKQLFYKPCFGEMASFIQGASNLSEFHKNGCHVWDGNANADYWTPQEPGDLGRIYGVQWREWAVPDPSGQPFYVDQLKELVQGLKLNPYGRRHMVTAWNPGELTDMCLPPCHTHFQCYVSANGELDLQVYMRSVDLFLGLPFDIAGYALLQRLIAKEANLSSRRLLFTLGDTHIYLNHLEAVRTVLTRFPGIPPKLSISPEASLFNFTPSHAVLHGYIHQGPVKAELNV